MIKSMTGYGRAQATFGEKVFLAEVRSLNSKQLDLGLRINGSFKEKEAEIRNKVTAVVERGKADFAVYMENNQETPGTLVNRELVKSYLRELKSIGRELGLPDTDLLPVIMKMPDILKPQKETLVYSDEEWIAVWKAIDKTLADFDSFRKKEGKILEGEFRKRIGLIISGLKSLEPLDKKRFDSVSKKIRKSLKDHLGKESIDANRFEQELIYYFEKLDISEEKLRLKTHCDYFIKTLKEDSPGRKLNFISQEIGREINTIGSKANDAPIQKIVVSMKDELEKIKEQLMNVL